MRASRGTFSVLVGDLTPHLQKQDTVMRKAIPVEKRVATGLWHFGHESDNFRTAAQFDVGTSTVHGIVMDFVNAIIAVYPHRLFYPLGEDLDVVIKGFENKWQLPNYAGAIDCSHVRIKTPHMASYRDYVDRSGKKSVVLQAIVDSHSRFLDMIVGWPGSVHDTRIFNHSPVWAEHSTWELSSGACGNHRRA
jgi:hypothetical protein